MYRFGCLGSELWPAGRAQLFRCLNFASDIQDILSDPPHTSIRMTTQQGVSFNMFNGLFWHCAFRRRLFLQDLCTASGCLGVCAMWKLSCIARRCGWQNMTKVWSREVQYVILILCYSTVWYVATTKLYSLLYHSYEYNNTIYSILILYVILSYFILWHYLDKRYTKWFHMCFADSGLWRNGVGVTMSVLYLDHW